MIIYVDIDGTVCHTENSDYENSIPRYNQIEKITSKVSSYYFIYIF